MAKNLKKEKRINFLLLLTLPPWYCIKHSCGMLITLVNPHVIFLLLEVTEWFKPSWILTWIQFLYLIPLLSLEYVQLRKNIHRHTWRKLWQATHCSLRLFLNFWQLEDLWSAMSYFISLPRWEKIFFVLRHPISWNSTSCVIFLHELL